MAAEEVLRRQAAAACAEVNIKSRSVSQMAVQLVLLVDCCHGLVGRYARDVLSSASLQGTGERWRDVLPLPVESRLMALVEDIVRDGEFKVKNKSGMSGGAVK